MIQASQLFDLSNILKPSSGHKAPTKLPDKVKVYLSTSFHDKEVVNSIINLLDSMRAGSYVDWLDRKADNFNQNRVDFAKRLVKMIARQDKYILVLTDHTLTSQWANWELGVAHMLKLKKDQLAIFPVTSDEDVLMRSEFRNIYPIIAFNEKCGDNFDSKALLNQFQIIYPPINGVKQKKISLQKWLMK